MSVSREKRADKRTANAARELASVVLNTPFE
jgi:hypothetical protein